MKNKIKIITAIFSLIVISIGITFAFYALLNKQPSTVYKLDSVAFSLNGEKNPNNIHTFHADKLDINDGYSMDLDLEVAGKFTGSFAVKYNIHYNLDSEDNLSNVTEVYQLVDGKYQFISMLNDFYKKDKTGYLGVDDSTNFSYLLVYSPNANNYYENKSFSLTVEATFEIVKVDDDFPYYYISNSSNSSSDVSVLKRLSQSIDSIKNKTIVLLEDITLLKNEEIIFNGKTGIDLNGHKLNLNGGKIKIFSTEYSENLCYLTDSKKTGAIHNNDAPITKDQIEVDLLNDFLIIDESFADITITNVSLPSLNEQIIKDFLSKNQVIKHVLNSDIEIDLLERFRYYFNQEILNIKVNESQITLNETVSKGKYSIYYNDLPEDDLMLNIAITISNTGDGTKFSTKSFNVNLLGTSILSNINSFLDNLNYIDGSIYLPVRDEATGAKFTYISSNNLLLSTEGVYLKNGLSSLSSFKNQQIQLTLIVELNNERITFEKTLEIEVLTIDERLEIFYDFNNIMIEDVGEQVSFDIMDSLISKHGSTDVEVLEFLKTNYGVATIDEFIEKLGLVGVIGTNIYCETNYSGTDYYLYGYDQLHTPGENENWVVDENGVYSGFVEYINKNGFSHFLLELKNKPALEYVEFNISLSYNFYLNDFDKTIGNYNVEKVITIVAYRPDNEVIDPRAELRVPFTEYDNNSNNLSLPYGEEINLVKETSKGTKVKYSIKNPCSYLSLNSDATKLYIKPAFVPNYDVIETIYAYVEGIDKPYELSFTVVGILHNSPEDIEDFNFYLRIRNDFDINNDLWISTKEAEKVTAFDYRSVAIETLKGIEFFTNLTKINFNNNKIIELSYLENLINLVEIRLINNLITDVSSLANLDKLEVLILSKNKITDISSLKYLIELKTIDLSNNNITSFSALSDYQNISSLKIFQNGVTSTSKETKYFLISAYNKTKKIVPTRDIKIYLTNDSSLFKPSDIEIASVEVISNVVVVSETHTTLNLPSEFIINNEIYSIEWISGDTNIIEFIKNSSDSGYTYIINQPIIDTYVKIGLTVKSNSGESLNIQREFYINFLQSPEFDNLTYIETSPGVYDLLSSVIPDQKLRETLFINFNTTTTGFSGDYLEKYTLTIDECKLGTALSLRNLGINSLDGIEYFINIQSLNLEGNIITSLVPLKELQFLSSLTLSSNDYDYEQLIGSKSSLQELHISSCYDLGSYQTKKKLYKLYNYFMTIASDPNSYLKIYKDNDTSIWNPYTEYLENAMRSLPHMYVFKNYLDTYTDLQIDNEFYLYDDVEPVKFQISNSNKVGQYKNYVTVSTNSTDGHISFSLNRLVANDSHAYYKIETNNNSVSKVINGVSYVIPISDSYYLYAMLEYNPCFKVLINDVYLDLNDVFPSRDLRDEVLNKLLSNLKNNSAYYNVDAVGNYLLTVADLGKLTFNEITLYGTYNSEATSALAGLKYLKGLTSLKIFRDANLGDGSDLINLSQLSINNSLLDFSKFSKTSILAAQTEMGLTATGVLKLEILTIENPNGFIGYNETSKNDENPITFNDDTKYYFNMLLNLNKLTILRTGHEKGYAIYDFRFLRPFIRENNLSYLNITGHYGAIFESTNEILRLMYNQYKNSSSNIPEYYVPEPVINAKDYVFDLNDKPTKVLFTPSAESYTEEEKALAEFVEFAGNITDYEMKISNSDAESYSTGFNDPSSIFHYNSLDQIITNGGNIYLPSHTKSFVTHYNGEEINNPYRKFDIDWRIVGEDLNTINYCFNTNFTTSTNISVNSHLKAFNLPSLATNNGILSNTAGKGKSYIDQDGNIKLYVTSLPYDYYIYFEGSLSYEGSTTVHSVIYPVLIEGTLERVKNETSTVTVSSNDTITVSLDNLSGFDNNFLYKIERNGQSALYYSYRRFEDLNLRLFMFLLINGSTKNNTIYHNESTDGGALFYCMSDIKVSNFNSSDRGAIICQKIKFSNRNVASVKLNNEYSLTFEDIDLDNTYKGIGLYAELSILTLNGFEIFLNLSEIYMLNKGLIDIDALTNLNNLTTIDFSCNMIESIYSLRNKPKLTSLKMEYNCLNSLYYKEYIDGELVYKNILSASSDSLGTLIVNGNGALDVTSLYPLSGDYFENNGVFTKIGNSTGLKNLKELNVNFTGMCFDFETIKGLNFLAMGLNDGLSLKLNIQSAHGDTNITLLKNELIALTNKYLNLYKDLNNAGYFTGISSNALTGSFTSTDGTFNYTLVNDFILDSSFKATLNGKFSVPVQFKFSEEKNFNFYFILNFMVITNATEQNNVYKMQIGGTTYDESKIYKINGVPVDIRDVFDDNLANYFLKHYNSITNLSYISAEKTLIFYDNFTTLDLTADPAKNASISSLKGLELLPSLTQIRTKNQPISVLPDWDSISGARITLLDIDNFQYMINGTSHSKNTTIKEEEWKKLIYLTNVTELSLKNIHGMDFNKKFNGVSLNDVFDRDNFKKFVVNYGNSLYDFTYNGDEKIFNYQESIEKIRKFTGYFDINGDYKPPTLVGLTKSSTKLDSDNYSVMNYYYANGKYSHEIILENQPQRDYSLKINILPTPESIIYGMYAANSFDTYSRMLYFLNLSINGIYFYTHTLRYAINLNETEEAKARDLITPFSANSVYNLPDKIYLNGIEISINYKLDYSDEGITLNNNVLSISSNPGSKTFTLNFGINGMSHFENCQVGSSIADQENPKVTDTFFIENTDGTYSYANQLFESSRFIVLLFNNMEINNDLLVSKDIQINGVNIPTNSNHILSQKEINSVTSLDIGNNGITSLDGIEIFVNLKIFRAESAFISLEPLRNFSLVSFIYISNNYEYTITDWSPLFNSRNTLTYFEYGKNTKNDYVTLGDMSFLMSFGEQLKEIKLSCSYNTSNYTDSFIASSLYSYLFGWFKINRPNTSISYNGKKTVISSSVLSAVDILSKFSTTQEVTYQNGYELIMSKNSVLLPSHINNGGEILNIEWVALSKFMKIENNILTIENANQKQNHIFYLGLRLKINNVYYDRIFTVSLMP